MVFGCCLASFCYILEFLFIFTINFCFLFWLLFDCIPPQDSKKLISELKKDRWERLDEGDREKIWNMINDIYVQKGYTKALKVMKLFDLSRTKKKFNVIYDVYLANKYPQTCRDRRPRLSKPHEEI